jgi:predicted PurR-regulated permease PerM
MNKGWAIIALVVAGLYWLQTVLIPVAMAILLTFFMSPVVVTLQRRGLGRVPAVLVSVVLALSVLGGIGWMLTRQLVTLADELPQYSLNIHQRIANLRGVSVQLSDQRQLGSARQRPDHRRARGRQLRRARLTPVRPGISPSKAGTCLPC